MTTNQQKLVAVGRITRTSEQSLKDLLRQAAYKEPFDQNPLTEEEKTVISSLCVAYAMLRHGSLAGMLPIDSRRFSNGLRDEAGFRLFYYHFYIPGCGYTTTCMRLDENWNPIDRATNA